MKLESTRIKGVLRFKDEVSLDYRDLPPGLIAFVGENGEGKSTMLEAPIAGTLREFPSRADKTVLDYTTLSDAFIENTFELEGQGLFIARLSLDGPHRKAEGVLKRVLPDGTAAFLNDGKVTTYETAIRQILPPKELLLASVFAAQNRHGSFGELDRKGRRELFATLLALSHLQQMSEYATSAAKVVQVEIDTLTAVRDVLAREAGETVERELEQRAQQLHADGGQIDLRREALARDLATIEAEMAALQASAELYARARTDADRLEIEIQALTRRQQETALARDRHVADAAAQIAALTKATTAALTALGREMADPSRHTADVQAIRARLAAARADADERIANNQKTLADEKGIRGAVAQIAQIDAEIATIRKTQQAGGEHAEAFRRGERVLRDSLAAIELAEVELTRAVNGSTILGTVPFGEKCEEAACQFLQDALTAKAGIPALRATVETKPATLEQLRTLEASIAALGAHALRWQEEIRGLESSRRALQAQAERLPKLETAKERITDLAQAKAEAEAQAERDIAAAKEREAARVADLDRRTVERDREGQEQLDALNVRLDARALELDAAAADLAQRIAALTSERDALQITIKEHAEASTQMAAQQALLTLRRREWDASTADLARVTSQQDALTQQMARLLDRRQELDAANARIEALRTDVVEWAVLAKALGRDGLQTIEIDEAGPTVSKLTNDLLESSYGSRFTIDLVTQEPLKSKTKDGQVMKDVFEVKVFDARDGVIKDIADLSGGEKVIVEEALKSAIAVFVNMRNPHPIRTCWRDETTGALNAENAQRYMHMLRRVREIGGFHHLIFITHNEDAAILADAQVVFSGGALEVRLPPYGVSMAPAVEAA